MISVRTVLISLCLLAFIVVAEDAYQVRQETQRFKTECALRSGVIVDTRQGLRCARQDWML